MLGYPLIQLVENIDYRIAGLEFLDPDEKEEIQYRFTTLGEPREFHPREEMEKEFVVVIHNRLFLSEITAWLAEDGELYVEEEEFERQI